MDLGLLTLLALASMSAAGVADPPRHGAAEIAVLVSPGASAYREASLGAVEALRADFGERVLEAVELDGPESVARGERLLAARPALVIAVGSRAAKLAHVKAPDVPLVYAMVLEPASVGLPSPGESPKQATTGVSMD
jgi:ABC-type uncharacterized transport system substrate-binding protein